MRDGSVARSHWGQGGCGASRPWPWGWGGVNSGTLGSPGWAARAAPGAPQGVATGFPQGALLPTSFASRQSHLAAVTASTSRTSVCGSGLRLTSLCDKRQVRPHSPKRSRWRTGLCLLRGRIASLRTQGTRAWLLSGPQHLAGAEGAAPGGGGGRGGGLDPAVRPLHSRWLQCASGCSTSCDLRPPRGPSSEPPSLPASGLVPAPRFRLGLPHPALAVPTSSGSCSAGLAVMPFPLSSPLRSPAGPPCPHALALPGPGPPWRARGA